MLEKDSVQNISISTNTIIRIFVVFVCFILLWFLRDILLVLFTSIVIASFMESAVPTLERWKISRVLGMLILYSVSIFVLAGMFYLFAPLLITEVYNFSSFLATYIPNANFLHFFQNEQFAGARDIVSSMPGGFSFSSLFSVSRAFIMNLSGGFVQTMSATFGSLFNLVLIVIISFYMSLEERGIENFLRVILPVKYEDYAVDLWQRSRRKIALWVKGQMLLGLLVAVLFYLVLTLLSVNYALILAIMAGLMGFVPYGSLIAFVPAVSISYLSGGLSTALMMTGAYIIINQFENFLFTPLIINRVVGLSPLVVILAALVGFELAGFWGLLLSIPGAVFVIEFMNDLEKRKIVARDGDTTR